MFKFSDLIEEVSEFNSELKYGHEDIIGVTIEKGLIPTVANLTQTALDKFYLVKPNTFIYNPRTHGVRLGMGFNESEKIFITSWNNVAFKIKASAENLVLPKFLWLYFLRPDWDRLSNFLAWGSSTIVFAWKDFLDIDISLPPLEKQREIVAEYNTLQNRIETNKKFIATLEQTAQTLFKKWSLESPQDCLFDDVAKIVMGQSPEGDFVNKEGLGEPLLNGPTEFGLFSPTPVQWTTTPKKMCENGDVLFCVRGSTTGRMNYANQRYAIGRGLAAIRARKKHYHWCMRLLLDQYMQDILASATGSTFPNVSSDMISKLKIVVPDDEIMKINASAGEELIELIGLKSSENQTLTQMQILLLSKMGC